MCGCGNDPSLEDQVKESMQKKLKAVPRLANSDLAVEKVTAKQVSGYDYEAVAKIGKVKEADDSRIRATFRYSGEGQTWVQDVVLDAQDGGKTLIRRDFGPDALPGPQKYTRCT